MINRKTTIFDDEAASSNVTPEDSPDTIIGNIRRTLAEYEKKMLGKETLENSDEPDPTSWTHFFDIPEEPASSLEHPGDILRGSTSASLRDSADAKHMIEVVEYSAIEGIHLDEEMLRELYGVKGDDDKEEDDDADKPVSETSD
jgi:hypothetical protein